MANPNSPVQPGVADELNDGHQLDQTMDRPDKTREQSLMEKYLKGVTICEVDKEWNRYSTNNGLHQ